MSGLPPSLVRAHRKRLRGKQQPPDICSEQNGSLLEPRAHRKRLRGKQQPPYTSCENQSHVLDPDTVNNILSFLPPVARRALAKTCVGELCVRDFIFVKEDHLHPDGFRGSRAGCAGILAVTYDDSNIGDAVCVLCGERNPEIPMDICVAKLQVLSDVQTLPRTKSMCAFLRHRVNSLKDVFVCSSHCVHLIYTEEELFFDNQLDEDWLLDGYRAYSSDESDDFDDGGIRH